MRLAVMEAIVLTDTLDKCRQRQSLAGDGQRDPALSVMEHVLDDFDGRRCSSKQTRSRRLCEVALGK